MLISRGYFMKNLYRGLICAAVVAGLSFAYASVTKCRNFEFDYGFTINDIPSNASDIRVWVPYPPNTACQRVENINPDIAAGLFSATYDKAHGNKILYYFAKGRPDSTIRFNIRYNVRRDEYLHKPEMASLKKETILSPEIEQYLKPNRLVTISPRIKRIASDITGDKYTVMDKARAIYDYVFENMAYDKSIPGWGNGDTERACDIRAGNCTDFHSLFISLCRAAGIPAKFLIGIKLPEEHEGTVGSYHCWAEFFVEGFGWVPVDISEAWKDKPKKDYYFGTLCEDRIEFSRGRDIILEHSANKASLNYFIYPYVEIDGKIFDNVEVSFKFKDM